MIIQCRHCNSPVIKGMEDLKNLPINVSFEMKCPHCQQLLKIKITYERVVILDEMYRTTSLGLSDSEK